MDLFPFKADRPRGTFALIVTSVIAVAVNLLIWFVLAFVIAYVAAKGVDAA